MNEIRTTGPFCVCMYVCFVSRISIRVFQQSLSYSAFMSYVCAGKKHSSDFSRLIAQVRGCLDTTRRSRIKEEVYVKAEDAQSTCSAGATALPTPQRHTFIPAIGQWKMCLLPASISPLIRIVTCCDKKPFATFGYSLYNILNRKQSVAMQQYFLQLDMRSARLWYVYWWVQAYTVHECSVQDDWTAFNLDHGQPVSYQMSSRLFLCLIQSEINGATENTCPRCNVNDADMNYMQYIPSGPFLHQIKQKKQRTASRWSQRMATLIRSHHPETVGPAPRVVTCPSAGESSNIFTCVTDVVLLWRCHCDRSVPPHAGTTWGDGALPPQQLPHLLSVTNEDKPF